jgi:hypothetical protein
VRYDREVTVMHVKLHDRAQAPPGLRRNVAFHRSMGRFYRKFYSGRNGFVDGMIFLATLSKLAIAVMRSAIARWSLA